MSTQVPPEEHSEESRELLDILIYEDYRIEVDVSSYILS